MKSASSSQKKAASLNSSNHAGQNQIGVFDVYDLSDHLDDEIELTPEVEEHVPIDSTKASPDNHISEHDDGNLMFEICGTNSVRKQNLVDTTPSEAINATHITRQFSKRIELTRQNSSYDDSDDLGTGLKRLKRSPNLTSLLCDAPEETPASVSPSRENKPKPEKSYNFVAGATVFEKRQRSCEDAHFITSKGVGVADGVSGWNQYGLNSAAFSNSLMQNCKKQLDAILNKNKKPQYQKKNREGLNRLCSIFKVLTVRS